MVVELIEKNLHDNGRNKQEYIRVRKEETDPLKKEKMQNTALKAQAKRTENLEARKEK